MVSKHGVWSENKTSERVSARPVTKELRRPSKLTLYGHVLKLLVACTFHSFPKTAQKHCFYHLFLCTARLLCSLLTTVSLQHPETRGHQRTGGALVPWGQSRMKASHQQEIRGPVSHTLQNNSSTPPAPRLLSPAHIDLQKVPFHLLSVKSRLVKVRRDECCLQARTCFEQHVGAFFYCRR